MTEWLEYERSRCLHEQTPDGLEDWVITMPRLSDKEGRWECGYLQKYETAEGKHLWRSLDSYRTVFRRGYRRREDAAQELVAECKRVIKTVERRKVRVAQMQIADLSPEARNAMLNKPN